MSLSGTGVLQIWDTGPLKSSVFWEHNLPSPPPLPAQMRMTDTSIKDMETSPLNDFTNGKLMGLNTFKSEMIQIYANEAEYALFRVKQTNCESGNKVGELLVWQLKESENSSTVPKTGRGRQENVVNEF